MSHETPLANGTFIRGPRRPRRRPSSCGAVRAVAEPLEGRRLLSATLFTIDPVQSQLVASGKIGNMTVTVQAQGNNPGPSLTTSLRGDIAADVGDGSITFFADVAAPAAEDGMWKPGSDPSDTNYDNINATEPASFAGQIIYGGQPVYLAMRDASYALGSSPIALAGDGSFDADQLDVTTATGTLYHDSTFTWGADSLVGAVSHNAAGAAGRFAVNNGVATLSVPISFSSERTINGFLVHFDFVGRIVATARLTGAPSVASVTASADSVAQGADVILSATVGADPNGNDITAVTFYRESNGAPGLQTGAGGDAAAAGTAAGATWTAPVSTAGLRPDVYTYYAQATDATGAVTAAGTAARSATVRVLPPAAGGGSIAGAVYDDRNRNGSRDAGEAGLGGWTVYLDRNFNQALDTGEPSTASDPQGNYTFAGLPAGTYDVVEVLRPDWEQTSPGGAGVAPSAPAPLPPPPKTTTTGSTAPVFPIGSGGARTSAAAGAADGAGDIKPLDAQSNPLIRLDRFRADPRFAGINGAGYGVAVLDTGIDLDHPYFGPDADGNGVADRIVFHHDFADKDDNASDYDGHGSNVTSIAAGQDATHPGMAPGANIIALKVFGDGDTGSFASIEAALQWVVANAAAYNIAAVNMSLGDSGNYNTRAARYGLGDELAALAAMNVIVASGAGNDYFEANGRQGVAYPASDPNSLSVGAVFDADVGRADWGDGATDFTTGPDRIASFSQRSTTLTSIFAPGPFSTGANQSGGTVDQGGTSQASPHIAGIAVLAQQLAMQRLGRRLTAAEFTGLMQSSGVTINDGDDENDNVTNTGADYKRVDVFALGEAILAMDSRTPRFTHRVALAAGEARGGVDFGNRSTAAAAAPTVTQVYVRGTGWTTSYLNSLAAGELGSAAFGHAVPSGAGQHDELPWGNLNRVSVRFSQPVSVQQADLVVTNSLGATIPFATTTNAFAYDAATFTASWTLARNLANEKVTLRLDGGAGGVTATTGGAPLDGEWANPTHVAGSNPPAFTGGDAYPSGDGTAGGDFVFSLRALPGDFNRNGAVNLADFGVIRSHFGGFGKTVLQGDASGDGTVNLADFGTVRAHFGKNTAL